jgi:antitoxin YefM
MLAVKSMDVRDNFKSLCDRVYQGETLIVSRPKNENIVMISEYEYNEMLKNQRNTQYLAKVDKSMEQLEQGKTITLSMNELEAMESEEWKPSPKVIEFMEKMQNE